MNSLQTRKAQQPTSFSTFITSEGVKRKVNEMVGGERGQAFITSIISAVSTNPQLSSCDQSTILSAALVGESLKLSPSPFMGHYYLVPFEDRKNNRKTAQFQIGYKGYLQLAMRSGQYRKINVEAIKQGELVKLDTLNEEIEVNLIEDPQVRESTPTIGYYAMFEYTNGFRKILYWSKEKMEQHALKYSQGYKNDKAKGTAYTFWSKDFDGMAYKTMLRQLISKWGILSIEMEKALRADMAVVKDDGTYDYVDNSASNNVVEELVEEEEKEIEEKEERVLEEVPAVKITEEEKQAMNEKKEAIRKTLFENF